MNNIRLLLRGLAAPGAVACAGAVADTAAVDLDIAAPGLLLRDLAAPGADACAGAVADTAAVDLDIAAGYKCWIDAAGDVVPCRAYAKNEQCSPQSPDHPSASIITIIPQ